MSLIVPEGVQAVDGCTNSEGARSVKFSSQVSDMTLPTSVLYVNIDLGIEVTDAYHVASDNPNYASTKEGILTSKDGTEYLGIPAGAKELDMPNTVTHVVIPEQNQLDALYVHATKDDELPTIDLHNLDECMLVIDDDVFTEFLIKNEEAIEEAGTVEVAKASKPNEPLTLSGGVLFSEDEIFQVLDLGDETAFTQLPYILKKDVFKGNKSTKTLVLMNYTREDLVLEDGCLADSSIKTLVCNSKDIDYVKSRLVAAGAPNVDVVAMDSSEEGFLYYTDRSGKTILFYDSWWVDSFDGTLTPQGETEKIPVNEISDYAFAGDLNLKWVALDKSVTKIGKGAFENCSSIQGFYIGAKDTIDVGKGVFKNCTSLGFVASCAKTGNFASTENPGSNGCTWYCPSDYEGGYDSRFAAIKDINDFVVSLQNDRDGADIVLYGCQEGDIEDCSWLGKNHGGHYQTPEFCNGDLWFR